MAPRTNTCRRALGLQRRPATNQIHQYHQARHLRTILECRRRWKNNLKGPGKKRSYSESPATVQEGMSSLERETFLLPEVCLFTLSILHTWSLSSWNIDVRRDLQCYKSLHFSYCKNTDTSAIFKLIHMHFGPYLVYGIVTIGTCIREDDVASWCMLCLVAIEFIMINENVYAALPRTKLHTPG